MRSFKQITYLHLALSFADLYPPFFVDPNGAVFKHTDSSIIILSLSISCCPPPPEHRASVKRLVSLQFLNPIHNRQDSLDGGSARRKAATYTEQHKHRIYSDIHAFSGIRTHDPSFPAGEDISCLAARPLWWWTNYYYYSLFMKDQVFDAIRNLGFAHSYRLDTMKRLLHEW
jgi:hypothetical protein